MSAQKGIQNSVYYQSHGKLLIGRKNKLVQHMKLKLQNKIKNCMQVTVTRGAFENKKTGYKQHI